MIPVTKPLILWYVRNVGDTVYGARVYAPGWGNPLTRTCIRIALRRGNESAMSLLVRIAENIPCYGIVEIITADYSLPKLGI